MAELYQKIVSVKLLVIVIIVFKGYPRTYCLMQGSCFICSTCLKFKKKKSKLKSQFKKNIFAQVAKVDVETKSYLEWKEDRCYPSEPVYVSNPNPQAEDDGKKDFSLMMIIHVYHFYLM